MTKKIWKNLEWKIALLVVFIAAMLSAAIYFIIYEQYYDLMIDKLKEDAIIVHKYAEEAIDEQTFHELNTRGDEESELYLATYSQLDEIRRIANIRYLYTAKRTESGNYVYVVDGLDRNAEDFRHVGDEIESEIMSQLSQSLNDEIVFGDRIQDTEWGIIYIVYFPFHDASGDVIGAIGMEFDCEHLYASLSRMTTTTVAISAIMVLVFVVVAYFAVKRLVRNTKASFAKMEDSRSKIENELREAEQRTKLMLDSSPICTQIWDKAIRTIDCNEAAVRLYGFKDKQEYIERFIHECSPEIQPDGRPSAETAVALVSKAFETGYWSGSWMHRIPACGTPMPAEVTLVKVAYGDGHVVLGYTRDLREHAKMMEDIEEQQRIAREEHENLKTLFDMLPIGVRIMSLSDRALLYANEALIKTFGCGTYEDVIAGVGRIFLPPTQPDGSDTNDVVAMLFQKSGYTAELQCLKLGGEPFTARFTSCAINYKGEPASLAVVEDITEEKEYQQSLQNIAIKEQEASKAKSVFLAKMSHEIRTPMNAIIGMSELALREGGVNEVKGHVHTIKQASTNLLAIINDILDFSKIEAGNIEVVSMEYSVASLINDVINIIAMRLTGSSVRFIANIDSNIPSTLFGDDKKIRQALINVLGNAVKYTESGFISLTAHAQPAGPGLISLIMEVSDSGRGIKQEDIGKLFGEFVQLRNKAGDDSDGVGLGLAITSSIVEAMGGSIGVESEYGEGSTFTITLPQECKTYEPLAYVESPESKSVLLYERRGVYAGSIADTLENLGISCIQVADGTELHEKLADGRFEFLFIPLELYTRNKDMILEHTGKTKVAVLTEFGETVTVTPAGIGVNAIVMPIYCVTVANLLNGVSCEQHYNGEGRIVAKFAAPDAKVLVVDDINTNLKVAQGLLFPYGMHVEMCSSGIKALEAVSSEDYDLIFMDHKMPDMDGIETTRHIRAMGHDRPYYIELPIVALTANAVPGIKEMYLENGFSDFLPKPIDIAELDALLEKWVPENKKEKILEAAYKPLEVKGVETGIAGVDIEKGISNMGGSGELYSETLACFCNDGAESIAGIRESLSAGNIQLYTIHIHGIKSAAAVIGADKLFEAAFALEKAGNAVDMVYVKANTESFVQALESTLGDIRDWLGSHSDL